MPVPAQTPVNSSTGNGVTTVFPYTFKILSEDDILVEIDGVEIAASAYSVSGVGDDNGGSVTFNTAPADSVVVRLARDMAIERTDIDYQEGGGFEADTVDEDIDRLVLIAQQLDAKIDDSLNSEGAPVSAFMAEVLDDETAEAALHTLGIDTVSVTHFMSDAQKASVAARDLAVDVTDAILAAANSFKTADRLLSVTDPDFGVTNCYVAGTIEFPDGLYKASYDQLLFTELFGLRFRGNGSRGASNFQRGASELVFMGTSSGFGIQAKGNAARNFLIEDMSVTYQGNTFTGALIDIWNSPGFNHHNAYIGSDGVTAPTRFTTAASLVQLTGVEFYRPTNSFLSGADYGVYFYTARSGTSFGAAGIDLSGITFYDFDEAMVATDGTYTVSGLRMAGTYFDPITVQPKRAVRMRKVDGLVIDGCMFNGASVSVQPSIEWMNLIDCQGKITGNFFGDRSHAGTLSGNLAVDGNFIFNTTGDGFRLLAGAISGCSNEFSDANKGWSAFPTLTITNCANNGSGLIRVTIAGHRLATGTPVTISGVVGTTEANASWTITEISADTFDLQGSTFTNAYVSGGALVSGDSLAIDLGPDTFTSSVTNSYVLETETNSMHGRINYSRERDGSASKWSVAETVGGRVRIENLDDKVVTSSGTSLSISPYDTGRTIAATNNVGTSQTITLPTPTPGTRYKIVKVGTGPLQIDRGGSAVIYTGFPATVTSVSNLSQDAGAEITFFAWATTAWLVESAVGYWSGLRTVGAALNVNTTAVGNVGSGEDNLMTYSLPANALSSTGRCVRVTAWGTSANNGNAKTLKFYFGSLAFTVSLTTSQAGRWRLVAEIIRTGSSTQDYVVQVVEGSGGTAQDVESGALTETETSAITIKCTGEATSNDDITQEGMLVELLN